MLALLSAALLLWQTRAGPAAQLLSIPGATALIWTATVWILTQRSMLARIAGVVIVVLIVSGLVTGSITRLFPRSGHPLPAGVNFGQLAARAWRRCGRSRSSRAAPC